MADYLSCLKIINQQINAQHTPGKKENKQENKHNQAYLTKI